MSVCMSQSCMQYVMVTVMSVFIGHHYQLLIINVKSIIYFPIKYIYLRQIASPGD